MKSWTRPLIRAASVAALLLVLAVGYQLGSRHDARAPADRVDGAILVMPVVVEGQVDVAWARLGLMDYIADRLRRAGGSVPSSESTLMLLEAADPIHSPADSRRPAGASHVIATRAEWRDRQWRIAITLTTEEDEQERVFAEDENLMRAVAAASDRVMSRLGLTPAVDAERPPKLDEYLQRAQAAVLGNRYDLARQALEAAARLDPDHPETRFRTAQVDFHEGHHQAAERLLDALLADPRVTPEALLHGQVLAWRGAARFALQRLPEAENDFTAAIAVLDPRQHPQQLGNALMGRGFTRSRLGRFEEALVDLGQARVHMLRGGDPLSVARLDGNLGYVEIQRRRPDLALPYFLAAAERFDALGAESERIASYSSLSVAHAQLLQHNRALAASEVNWRRRDRASGPSQRLRIHLDHALALIAVGRLREASQVLEDPELPDEDAIGAEPDRQRLAHVRVELAWRSGALAEALRLADRVLSDWPDSNWDLRRGAVVLRRQQAALALGRAMLAEPEPVGAMANDPHRLLARALALRARGDDRGADTWYRRALIHADRDAIAAEIVAAASDYAPWLIERGDLNEAGAVIGRVVACVDRDFDCATLEARLLLALGQESLLREALSRVRELAGERPIPPELSTYMPPSR